MDQLVHVAVGVIRRSNLTLLARRRAGSHQGGLWEFPGGKVEEGESVQHALARELREELAIEVLRSQPLIQVRHHYADKSVLLDVWEVQTFSGRPRGNEGQPLEWVDVGDLKTGADCPYPLPAANAAIVKALRVPDTLALTGEFVDALDFESRLARALQAGIRLVQLRPSRSLAALPSKDVQALVERSRALCTQYRAELVLNSRWPDAADSGCGLHLTSHDLLNCETRPTLAGGALLGTSCHNEAELARAAELDVDYAVLSPVLPTRSHRDAQAMGWAKFRELVARVNFPVYALGGMVAEDVARARAEGGQGIAAIGAFWGR